LICTKKAVWELLYLLFHMSRRKAVLNGIRPVRFSLRPHRAGGTVYKKPFAGAKKTNLRRRKKVD